MTFLSHVCNLSKVYINFDKYLTKNYPGEFSYISADYDEIIRPVINFINKYGYQRNDDIHDYLYIELKQIADLNKVDVEYLVILTALCIEYIIDDLIQRSSGVYSEHVNCIVSFKLLSTGYWMFYI